MTRKPTVCLAGTLDTKGVEYKYVKECIENQGVDVLMVDCGVIGEPYFTPDIPSSEVAAAAGIDLAEFAERKEGADGRTKAVLSMGRGLGVVLQKLYDEGRIDAVFGMGGTGGTDLLSPAFRELPIGFPKMIVSTMGSGNTKPYVGPSDLIMANAVTDIAGLNRISLLVLGNAAHAIAGMAKGYSYAQSQASGSKPLVAITMWGVTTPGVMRIREQLERDGFEVIIFHAVGEGAGMEALIDGGVIDGLIDYSLPEILNHWHKGLFDPGIDRMEAAIRAGIPMVVAPGALEAFNFGALSTIPPEFDVPERYVIEHNPNVSSLRATPEEMTKLGEYVADHVNRAPGPKAVAIPWKATCNYAREGSPWEGLDLHPMFDPLLATLDPSVEVVQMDANINDPEFADAVYALFQARWEQAKAAQA
ncbi:Tm-1-like ATP-binding domain-containing protein [Isoptericola sp. b441]|uniref:Tm-1-like ATP-binding domain-containing protein n=1 Tax=Actinotalea lenta TaxID=3064654 RepID=A0ABT9DCW2_9CELL|nr:MULTISPECIES: Tm-1-like ATP-binding domain-containing protein [unclassified Isoptericola]MDO8108366.1 Tm-1-like ATP-binding domain-containing protein [Isoptericola sp. b441]MDO8119784.1 Tm-1-like ATP-binding domain-containing protein [Isoptericola sp. b490]